VIDTNASTATLLFFLFLQYNSDLFSAHEKTFVNNIKKFILFLLSYLLLLSFINYSIPYTPPKPNEPKTGAKNSILLPIAVVLSAVFSLVYYMLPVDIVEGMRHFGSIAT
jgi:hypothetical protein